MLRRLGAAGSLALHMLSHMHTHHMRTQSYKHTDMHLVPPWATQLKALGIDNIMRFEWLAPPPAEAMVRALEALAALGVLDQDARCVPFCACVCARLWSRSSRRRGGCLLCGEQGTKGLAIFMEERKTLGHPCR